MIIHVCRASHQSFILIYVCPHNRVFSITVNSEKLKQISVKAAASQIPPEARLSILGRITAVLHEGFEIRPERTTTVRIRNSLKLLPISLLHDSHVILTV